MKIFCLDKEIGKLLREGFYKIPRFQRPYSWDHGNLEEFWNDTVVDNESDYFIGNFVFYEDGDTLGVVDGQQRLTTITLMLCALRDVMHGQGYHDLAKGVHLLIERPNIKNEKYYVLQPETSYPFFQEHIQKFGKKSKVIEAGTEEHLLKEAYEFLRGNLDQVVRSIKSQSNLSESKKKTKLLEELSKIRDRVLGLKVIWRVARVWGLVFAGAPCAAYERGAFPPEADIYISGFASTNPETRSEALRKRGVPVDAQGVERERTGKRHYRG